MSPSKLAAEMQKARARAREERFGTGSSASRPSALVRRKPSIGKLSVQQALPSAQAHAGNANERAADDGNRGSVNRVSPTPSPPPEASVLSPKVPPPAKTAGVAAVTVVSASSSASGVGTVAGATRTTEANGLHRQSLASPAARASDDLPSVALTPPTPTSSAPAPLPIVTPVDIGEDGQSPPGASGRFVTVVNEVSPVDTAAKMSPPKKPAPARGDVVIIEPPAKTAGASSPAPAQGDTSKVHTLRLRLRTDLPGGEQTPFGGVEESKTFEPPSSPVDGGVEECKGFDPPNLPPTPQKQQPQQKRQPSSSPSTTVVPLPTVGLSAQGKPPQPPLASAVSNPEAGRKPSPSPAAATSPSISRSKSSDEVAEAVVLSRERSWGPSFGIAVTTETAAPAVAAAAPAALPKPVVDPRKNPWVLSPDAPTFAKNRGRPLARSFSQPNSNTDAVNGGVGKDDNLGLGRDHGTARGPGVAGSAVGSSGGGDGGRGEGGASGHDRRRASRPADTPLVARPPPTVAAGAAATPAAVGAGAAATPVVVVVGGGGGAATAATAAAAAAVCVKAENESGVQRVAQTVLASSEPNLRATGGEGGVSGCAATRAEGGRGPASVAEGPTPDARPEESVLGVRVGRRAGELLERLRREREESLDFERKLTQALLDL